jgi:phospholipid/cholesterol/gamma-HCH transport system substrate-binding protein
MICMDKSYKFRRVNELTGAFVMVAVALLVTAVFLAGRAQQWFEPEYELIINVPIEGSLGLQKGASVTILGMPAGTVKRIDLAGKNQLQAVLRIRGHSVDFIKTDSVAVIKRKLGVAGDAFIDITAGENGAPIERTGATVIDCRNDAEVMEIVQNVLEQVQRAAVPAIDELQKTVMEFRLLAADLRDPEGNLQQILAQARGTLSHVDPLLVGLEKGEGTVGMFLKDPATAKQIETLFAEINEAVVQLNKTLSNITTASDLLPEAANAVRDELRDVPGVVLQTRATLYESERLLQAIQQHWLIRSHMQEYNPLEAIPVDAVQGGSSGEVSQ